MAGTDHLAEIQQRCDAAGAKLLLVGDPRQLAAVGPGGALADVAEHGLRYELADVRRFSNDWERAASLRLRDGDPTCWPSTTSTAGSATAAPPSRPRPPPPGPGWPTPSPGDESLLMVGTNAAAARVSAALRAELVELGRVAPTGVALGREGWAGRRRRGRRPRAGPPQRLGTAPATPATPAPPINRETYRVTALRPDGGLTVAPIPAAPAAATEPGRRSWGSRCSCPAGYVAADLTLAYASTVHAAEGRTVDTATPSPARGTDLAGLLVPLTRGPGGQHRLGHHPRPRPRRRRPGRPSTSCPHPAGGARRRPGDRAARSAPRWPSRNAPRSRPARR